MDKLIVYLNLYQQPEAYSNFHITFIDNFRSFKLNQLKSQMPIQNPVDYLRWNFSAIIVNNL